MTGLLAIAAIAGWEIFNLNSQAPHGSDSAQRRLDRSRVSCSPE